MGSENIPRKLKGNYVWWVASGLDRNDICIYGDPTGLRSLGNALIAIADLDQRSLAPSECPSDDSFHQHYILPNGIRDGLPGLILGRADEKVSGEIRDCFLR